MRTYQKRFNRKMLKISLATVLSATAITLGIGKGIKYIDMERKFIHGAYIHMEEHIYH